MQCNATPLTDGFASHWPGAPHWGEAHRIAPATHRCRCSFLPRNGEARSLIDRPLCYARTTRESSALLVAAFQSKQVRLGPARLSRCFKIPDPFGDTLIPKNRRPLLDIPNHSAKDMGAAVEPALNR